MLKLGAMYEVTLYGKTWNPDLLSPVYIIEKTQTTLLIRHFLDTGFIKQKYIRVDDFNKYYEFKKEPVTKQINVIVLPNCINIFVPQGNRLLEISSEFTNL